MNRMIDVTSVSVNRNDKKGINELVIVGTDLDDCLLNWQKEFDRTECVFKFPLSSKGARTYAYKLVKSQVKDPENYKTLSEMALSLTNRIISINENFLDKTEG